VDESPADCGFFLLDDRSTLRVSEAAVEIVQANPQL
jgi:hypothetical protein